MSTAIAKNLMAEMKLLGMLAAFDKALTDATRDQTSYSEFARYAAAGRSRLSPGTQRPAIASKPPSSRCARRSRTSTSPPAARSPRRRSRNSTASVAERCSAGAADRSDRCRQDLHRPGGRPARLRLRQIGAVHELTTWLENLALARSSGTYLRYRDKLAKPDLVILDDMGMRKLSATEAQDLCELLEERSINKSIVFTTQLPLDHWSEVIADPVIADAIRDRLRALRAHHPHHRRELSRRQSHENLPARKRKRKNRRSRLRR